MDRETLIRAILECNFAGYDSDIIDIAVKRIMESTGDVIVHCKDCKYYEEYEKGKYWCWVGILGGAKPTDFCSYGKGREDAKVH